MAIWPSTLPQIPSASGYRESPGEQSIRSNVDVGPPKLRRRTTAAFDRISCQFDLNKTQADDLDTFYETTLQGGSDQWDWTHPRKLTTRQFRFVGRPTLEYVGPDDWIAHCELEVMP